MKERNGQVRTVAIEVAVSLTVAGGQNEAFDAFELMDRQIVCYIKIGLIQLL